MHISIHSYTCSLCIIWITRTLGIGIKIRTLPIKTFIHFLSSQKSTYKINEKRHYVCAYTRIIYLSHGHLQIISLSGIQSSHLLRLIAHSNNTVLCNTAKIKIFKCENIKKLNHHLDSFHVCPILPSLFRTSQVLTVMSVWIQDMQVIVHIMYMYSTYRYKKSMQMR